LVRPGMLEEWQSDLGADATRRLEGAVFPLVVRLQC
jgi:hypothetical protein